MKTTNKKHRLADQKPARQKQSSLHDKQGGNKLFQRSISTSKFQFLSDTIEIKSAKDKRNKSFSLLISSISLCISLLVVIWAFELKFSEKGSVITLENEESKFEALVEIPQTQQVVKPPVQIQAPKIIEVKDEEIIEEIEINLDIEMTEETRIAEVEVFEAEEVLPEEKVDEIFTIVEVQPSPVGGMRAFYQYVGNNLKYPKRASRMGVEGRVFVEFIVEKDGSLTDVKIAKGIGAGCDEEALRVLNSAPNWNPGKQRGNPVRVRMVMPIMFKLMNA